MKKNEGRYKSNV